MDDFSSFIHEEIFLINSGREKGASTVSNEIPAEEKLVDKKKEFLIGVIAENASDQDKNLLNKILSAISIDAKSVLFNSQITEEANTWIVFSDNLDFIQNELQYYSVSTVKEATIITSKPLGFLRNSVEDKSKLWSLLKEKFNT